VEKTSVIKHGVKHDAFPPGIHQGIYSEFMLPFLILFLCNNRRRTNSSSNSVSKLKLTEETWIRHSDALKRHTQVEKGHYPDRKLQYKHKIFKH
jgi:hypothetical protein